MITPKIVYVNQAGETKEVIFPLPPDEDPVEKIRSIDKQFVSDKGIRQVVPYATEHIITYTFSVMPLDFINGPLKEFHVEHGLKGRFFKYFVDKDKAEYTEYELNKRMYSPAKNGSTIDRYDIDLEFRRVE